MCVCVCLCLCVCVCMHACMHACTCVQCSIYVCTYYINSTDLREVIQNVKAKRSTNPSSDSPLVAGSEGKINSMESSGVYQPFSRVLSNTEMVNKTILPPSAN